MAAPVMADGLDADTPRAPLAMSRGMPDGVYGWFTDFTDADG